MFNKFKDFYPYAQTDDNNVNLDKSEKDEKKDETIIPGVYRGYKPSGSAADALNASFYDELSWEKAVLYGTRICAVQGVGL